MTKIIQTIFLIFVFTGFALAQVIGPGGVGNTSTLKLWLKADDLSLSNGSLVANWPDASGNVNNASQSTALNQPTFNTNVIIRFNLDQNYPNPFNPKTVIRFGLPQDAKVSLKIYNALGELVQTLIDQEVLNAGSYEKEFDASSLPSGVYIYRLSSDKFNATKKMVLMK